LPEHAHRRAYRSFSTRGAPGAGGSPQESLERIFDFLRASLARTADQVQRIDAGLLATTPSLPAVWWLNQLRVNQPLTFEAVAGLADEHQSGLGYRQITVEHQGAGPELERAFRAASWKVERDLLMVLDAEPDRPGDTSVVVDAGEEEVMALMERWHNDDRSQTPQELAELVASSRREVQAHDSSLLGVRSSDGKLVAMTQLRSHESIGQVEDVYTVAEARGRGYARALVTHAIELARGAGHDLVFITADDEGWPKLLYERLGFRGIGRIWQFHHP
jgi:GNAT superfamily N-acetyltransferase